MRKALVIPNIAKPGADALAASVVGKLADIDIASEVKWDFWCDRDTEPDLDFSTDADVIIVIGGDGSVLDAAKYSYEHGIPIFCINLGKVGYLSEVEPTALDTLNSLVTGEYFIDEKLLLEVTYSSDPGVKKYAVNDVVISHDTFLGIANIHLEDATENAISYRADGLIIATPQGSTAYSLSAGGPVVAHNVESIIVTPVCAHSFFNRSVLFNSSDEIKVKNLNNDVLKVSTDGRLSFELAPGEFVSIKKADIGLKMVSFSKNGMFSNLFKKMRILEENN